MIDNLIYKKISSRQHRNYVVIDKDKYYKWLRVEWNRNNKESRKLSQLKYRKSEKGLAARRAMYARNPQKYLQRNKEWIKNLSPEEKAEWNKKRNLYHKIYRINHPEYQEKQYERIHKFWLENKDKPEFKAKRRAYMKEYRKRKQEKENYYRLKGMESTIRDNPPYTTSRGLKITFLIKDLMFYYRAENRNYMFLSEGFKTFCECKKDARLQYGY